MNSDCCGCEVGFESGEGDDMIGICMGCKEWCGVVQDDSEDEGMIKALEDNSMTMKERRIPKIIIGSRKRRIAMGSGTEIQDVNRLLKQYNQMQKMMKKFTKPGGIKQMMRGMGGMAGMKGMLPDEFK